MEAYPLLLDDGAVVLHYGFFRIPTAAISQEQVKFYFKFPIHVQIEPSQQEIVLTKDATLLKQLNLNKNTRFKIDYIDKFQNGLFTLIESEKNINEIANLLSNYGIRIFNNKYYKNCVLTINDEDIIQYPPENVAQLKQMFTDNEDIIPTYCDLIESLLNPPDLPLGSYEQYKTNKGQLIMRYISRYRAKEVQLSKTNLEYISSNKGRILLRTTDKGKLYSIQLSNNERVYLIITENKIDENAPLSFEACSKLNAASKFFIQGQGSIVSPIARGNLYVVREPFNLHGGKFYPDLEIISTFNDLPH